jgi:hypothetical protein
MERIVRYRLTATVCVAAVLAGGSLGLCHKKGQKKGATMSNNGTPSGASQAAPGTASSASHSGGQEPFTCDKAAALLGHPGARVISCQPYKGMPDFYWVILEGGDLPGAGLGQAVFLDDGQLDPARGYGAAARYLRRIHIYERPDIPIEDLTYALSLLGGLPPGFQADAARLVDPTTGEKSTLDRRPFQLKLMSPDYRPPPPVPTDTPGPPPSLTEGLHLPGLPPGAPSPGAFAQPRPGRALLRGDEHYRFTWTIEIWDRGERRWKTESTQPLEP